MLWMLLISSIPFILLAGGIYGDYKATGYFPWQKEFDVKCFHVKKCMLTYDTKKIQIYFYQRHPLRNKRMSG